MNKRLIIKIFCVLMIIVQLTACGSSPKSDSLNGESENNEVSQQAVAQIVTPDDETENCSEEATSSKEVNTKATVKSTAVKNTTAKPASTKAVALVVKYNPSYTFEDVLNKLSPYSVEKRLQMLKTYFPNGKYWNHAGYSVQGLSQSQYCMITTDKKCNHIGKYSDTCNHYIGKEKAYFEYDDNYQCLAFASMISDLLYGPNAEVVKHSDFDKIKVGDHIRFVSRTHSVIVIEKTASSVKVVECNYQKSGCKIAWGRVIGKDFFKTCGTYFVLSRKEQVKKEEPKEEPKPEQKEEPKEEPKEEQKEESEEEKPQEEVSSQVTSSEEQQEEEKSES